MSSKDKTIVTLLNNLKAHCRNGNAFVILYSGLNQIPLTSVSNINELLRTVNIDTIYIKTLKSELSLIVDTYKNFYIKDKGRILKLETIFGDEVVTF